MHYDLIVRRGACVLPWATTHVDLGIRHGRIAAIGLDAADTAEATFDAAGLHVLPGLIDPHVHFRDPGAGGGDPSVETIATGSRGAVLGGIATVFDMPNTTPPATTAAALAAKRAHATATSWCDIGLYVGASRDNIGELAALEATPGACGIKVFAGSSTGPLLIEDDATIERVLRCGRRRVSFHSEDEYRLQARRPRFAAGGPFALHAEWRDEQCALLGTRRILALARITGRPVHILHVSTAEEFAHLAAFKDVATAEVLVNHLTQAAPDAYDRLGGYAVMNPPIRTERHRAAAWAAVADGTVDTIGSDHAPHSRAAKERAWPATAAGLTGVQTTVPLMLDHVNAGRLSLARMVDLMAAGPARVYGLRNKGRLAVGADADLTIVDLKRERTIEESWIASPCGWTPFAGTRVAGWPHATFVRGHLVMQDDEVPNAPIGRLAAFI